LFALLGAACAPRPPSPRCPREARAAAIEITPRGYRDPALWLRQWSAEERSRTLLSRAEIDALNVANRAGGQGPRDVAAPALALAETSEGEVRASLRALDDQVDHGALVPTPPGDYPESRRVALASVPADAWYVAPSELELRCVPTAGQLLTPGGSAAFDRNRCSEAHPGEVLRVVRTSVDGGWQYAHTRHVSGWVRAESLGPRVSPADAALFLRPARRAVLLRDNVDVAPGARLRLGAALPLLELDAGIATVMAPMRDGVGRVRVAWDPSQWSQNQPSLTRENFFRLAMARVGEPYGWGGWQGGRDCSRLVLDLFATFGIELGRNSQLQGRSGLRTEDLRSLGERDRLARIRVARREGLVLLVMPGHVMVDLGEIDERGDGRGTWALSAIAEFCRACAPQGQGSTLVHLERVEVAPLSLGAGTPRGSFLSRLHTLTVFGG